MNKVFLLGRLGQDPQLAYTPSGTPVVNISLATNSYYKGEDGLKEHTEWHRVVLFGGNAEFCAQYLTKGSLALIEGSLRTRKWEDKNGNTRYTTEVVAFKVRGLNGFKKKEGDNKSDFAEIEGDMNIDVSEMDDTPF